MSKRIGAQTTALPSCPGLIGWAGIAGQKEKEGPYGAKFDWDYTGRVERGAIL